MSAPLVSRGPMGLVAAIFAGGLSVAFLVTALLNAGTALIFLAYFAALPLYLAGLGGGALAGVVAPVVATAALYATQPPNISVIYALAYAIPAIIITALSLRHRSGTDAKMVWYPEGNILTAITLYPCVLFLLAAGIATSHPGGLLAITQQAFAQISEKLAVKFDADQLELFHSAIDSAARIAPALIAYTWILVAIISVAAAQYILILKKWNLRDNFTLQNLHMPTQLIYGVALTGLVGVLASAPYDYIGRNLSLIMGLPFFFVGLAVLHAWANSMPRAGWVLFSFYVVMIFIPWMALIVAALGVVDQWFDFRQRIARKNNRLLS